MRSCLFSYQLHNSLGARFITFIFQSALHFSFFYCNLTKCNYLCVTKKTVMDMKRLSIFVSILLTLFLSCTKNENLLEKPQEDSTSIEQFSILLSKAVYSEPSRVLLTRK